MHYKNPRHMAISVPTNKLALPMTGGGTRGDYHQALEVLMALKGERVVDVARDDAVISLLMSLPEAWRQKVVEECNARNPGYPTVGKIDEILTELQNTNFGVHTENF